MGDPAALWLLAMALCPIQSVPQRILLALPMGLRFLSEQGRLGRALRNGLGNVACHRSALNGWR